MSHGALHLITASSAAQVAKAARLSDPARLLLTTEQKPEQFLSALVAHHRYKDAYSFLAAALPLREAVWWAALCIRQSHATITAKDSAALRAALTWALNPSSDGCRRALAAGMASGKTSASGCLALAVGQLAAAPTAPVSPAPRYVRRAILLASVHGDPRVLEPYPRHFVKLGVGVAAGDYTWKKLLARP